MLTKHFSLAELASSRTALRLGIPNIPNAREAANLKLLAENILEPIREHFGLPFTPTSCYRGFLLNSLVGGVWNSQHRTGEAADIKIPAIDAHRMATWVQANLNFDQLILENYRHGDVWSGFCHISFSATGRQRKDVFTKKAGSRLYTRGIHR